MSSRKEQKEALRREREERERQAAEAARRRRLAGYGAGGGLVAVVLVVVAVLLLAGGGDGGGSSDLLPGGGKVPKQRITDLKEAAGAAGCEVESLRARSRDHTQDIDEQIQYDSNPPSSGRHFELPADDGLYDEAPRDAELVHSMEHGRVVIWFKPSLPKDSRAGLRALFDEEGGFQLLLTPRRNMPYAVAATAWNAEPAPNGTGRLLGCPRFSNKTFDALQTFIEEHRGNGPEPVP
jgi:hypothetical protein